MHSQSSPSPSLVTPMPLCFQYRNLLALTSTAKVSAACSSWQRAVKASIKAGIFLLKLSLSPLQHISSYQKSILQTTPCCPTCTAAHSCHIPLPLKNLLLRTRQNMSLNNREVPHKNPFGQQYESSAFLHQLFSTCKAHGSVSEQPCAPGNVRAAEPFPLLCPQDGVCLPHTASRLPLIRTLFSSQLWSGSLSEQDKGFALCRGSV